MPSLKTLGFGFGTAFDVVRWDCDTFFYSTSIIYSTPFGSTFVFLIGAGFTISICESVTGRGRFLPISGMLETYSFFLSFYLLADLSGFCDLAFDFDFWEASAYVFLTLRLGTMIFLLLDFGSSSSSESCCSEPCSEDSPSSTRSLTESTKNDTWLIKWMLTIVIKDFRHLCFGCLFYRTCLACSCCYNRSKDLIIKDRNLLVLGIAQPFRVQEDCYLSCCVIIAYVFGHLNEKS